MMERMASGRTFASKFNRYFNYLDRIFIIHILLLSAGFGVILFFVYRDFQQEKIKIFQEESLSMVKHYGSIIRSDLNNLKSRLMELAQRPSIVKFDKDGEDTLNKFQKFYNSSGNKRFLVSVRRISEELKTVYAIPECQDWIDSEFETKNLLDPENVMKPCVCEFFKDSHKSGSIAVYNPLFDSNRKFTGYISALVDLDSFISNYLREIQARHIGRAWIIDNKGNLILPTAYQEKALKGSLTSEIKTSLLKQMINKKEGVTLYGTSEKGNEKTRLLVFSQIRIDKHADWFICMDATYDEISESPPRFVILKNYYFYPVLIFIFMGAVLIFGYRYMAKYYNRLLKEELLQSQKMEALGMFVNGLVHDFNNLIQLISGVSHILKENNGIASENDIKVIDEIADKSHDLTSRLIAFSRGGTQRKKQLVNVNSCIENMLSIIHLMLNHGVNLKHVFDHNIPEINASPAQIEEIIINLCVNAFDAMPGNGTLTIQTKFLTSPECADGTEKKIEGSNKYIQISVSDTGKGIPKNIQKKIFEPFFTTKGEKGTGLGLSTVAMIVEDLKGKVTFESEMEKGTTFHILLPVR